MTNRVSALTTDSIRTMMGSFGTFSQLIRVRQQNLLGDFGKARHLAAPLTPDKGKIVLHCSAVTCT